MFALTLDRRGRESDAMGEIVIGAHRESCLIDLSHWSAYITWACRVRGGEAVFDKSLLLPSATEAYKQPEQAEAPAEDYAERNNDEPKLNLCRCSLRDIAEFEIPLRGATAH